MYHDALVLLKRWLIERNKFCHVCQKPAVQCQENGDWSGSSFYWLCGDLNHKLEESSGGCWVDPPISCKDRQLVEDTMLEIAKGDC